MCLAVLALDAHPLFPLVIAANRDEAHARRTAPAQWWREGWVAGRDLEGGGTWLGLHPRGTWALLTNIRDPARKEADAPTRGTLVTRVLASPSLAQELEAISRESARYNGFNLVAGSMDAGMWLSNREGGPHRLGRGIHALSNAALDTPWPKVVRIRAAMAEWCRRRECEPGALFEALASRTMSADRDLPRTGIALERERVVSAAFIVDPVYGTRSSTVVLVDRHGKARFIERSFDAKGEPTDHVDLALDMRCAATARGSSPGGESRLP